MSGDLLHPGALNPEEQAQVREGFKQHYQDFWRNLALSVDATPTQLGTLMEVVGNNAEGLLAIKLGAFWNAAESDGSKLRRKKKKVQVNVQDMFEFVDYIKQSHRGISDYDAFDQGIDYIVMKKINRTVDMGNRLAALLISDERIFNDGALRQIVIDASHSFYNAQNTREGEQQRHRQ